MLTEKQRAALRYAADKLHWLALCDSERKDQERHEDIRRHREAQEEIQRLLVSTPAAVALTAEERTVVFAVAGAGSVNERGQAVAAELFARTDPATHGRLPLEVIKVMYDCLVKATSNAEGNPMLIGWKGTLQQQAALAAVRAVLPEGMQ